MASRRQLVEDLFARDASLLRDLAAGKVGIPVAPYVLTEALAKSASAREHTAVAPLGSLQALIRPVFGKVGIKTPTFGDHPDYVHLRGTTTTERGPITTLFLDVANSTRLGLLYPLELVYVLKNAVLCTAIEIANAFDGHVQRLMGDAALAFFGDKGRSAKDGAIAPLNCAAVLRYYVEAVVIPALDGAGGPEDGLGIRVGVDHGAGPDVLWSAYGYPGNEEVTATSFYVDVASKLQHAAGRNQIMVGQRVRELLDFPERLLRDKTEIVDGQSVAVPFVRPNYTLRDGTRHNYRQHLLRWDDYLATTGAATFDPARFTSAATHPDSCQVTVSVHAAEHGVSQGGYAPASRMLPKGAWLRFAVSAAPQLRGADVTFAVENHGADAAKAPNNDNHETHRTLGMGADAAVRWESCQYRGLHYMTITVAGTSPRSTAPVFRQRIGIYVA